MKYLAILYECIIFLFTLYVAIFRNAYLSYLCANIFFIFCWFHRWVAAFAYSIGRWIQTNTGEDSDEEEGNEMLIWTGIDLWTWNLTFNPTRRWGQVWCCLQMMTSVAGNSVTCFMCHQGRRCHQPWYVAYTSQLLACHLREYVCGKFDADKIVFQLVYHPRQWKRGKRVFFGTRRDTCISRLGYQKWPKWEKRVFFVLEILEKGG